MSPIFFLLQFLSIICLTVANDATSWFMDILRANIRENDNLSISWLFFSSFSFAVSAAFRARNLSNLSRENINKNARNTSICVSLSHLHPWHSWLIHSMPRHFAPNFVLNIERLGAWPNVSLSLNCHSKCVSLSLFLSLTHASASCEIRVTFVINKAVALYRALNTRT